MKTLVALLLLGVAAVGEAACPPLPARERALVDGAFSIAEHFGPLAWPGFTAREAPVLYIRGDCEYLLNASDWVSRPRTFPPNLEASFPAIGRDAVVIGTPAATKRTPEEWQLVFCHELFHIYQRAHGMVPKIAALGLAPKNDDGMWMLNFPFPYDDPRIGRAMHLAGDEIVRALGSGDPALARDALENLLDSVGRDTKNAAYLRFVITNEGVARYFEYRLAQLAGGRPWRDRYVAMPAQIARLGHDTNSRGEFYNLGLGIALLLDRVNPRWKASYFDRGVWLDDLLLRNPATSPPGKP